MPVGRASRDMGRAALRALLLDAYGIRCDHGSIMIPTQPFGATGHHSTLALFGGAVFTPESTRAEADRALELLLHHGVNHLDTAHSYGAGNSEELIGPWMEQHRDRFFLATKTNQRTAEGARAQLELSRRRLRSDTVDLIQLHNLTGEEAWEPPCHPAARWMSWLRRASGASCASSASPATAAPRPACTCAACGATCSTPFCCR